MLVVVALGGNALIRRGERADADVQRHNVAAAVTSIATIAQQHDVVVTHGNGPQVGLLALQSEAYHDVRPYPLDVLDAETEGMLGYLLEQGLRNALPGRRVAALLTQVVVRPDDPAFATPSKPVGPVYDRAEATRLAHARGWQVVPDGSGFRRVVPSPEPYDIIELDAVQTLLDAGTLVICTGGGGIPVAYAPGGALHGVEAVIDKDLAAALLATRLHADALLILTDVPAVMRDWGEPAATPIAEATPAELRGLRFARGSMGPKVEAACRFVEAGGAMAGIGTLSEAAAILDGNAGTVVTRARTAALAGDHRPAGQ